MAYVKKKKAQDPSYKLKRKKSNRKHVATTQLFFALPAAVETGDVKYIDLAQSLSMVNRKLYRQGMCYYVHSIVARLPNTSGASSLDIQTVPDTWIANNAWVKAFSLWNEMNQKVLADNPSVKGKWLDFKVFYDGAHYSGGSTDAGPNLNLLPNTINEVFNTGEWNMSDFVRPQHEVDPATGLPLAADLFTGHMLGADVGSLAPGSTLNSGGIIEMYQDTRARVQDAPAVPADMSESWGTLLTDDGSQEPELADVLEGDGDTPPYSLTVYSGSGTATATKGTYQCRLTAVPANYDIVSTFNGFLCPLGLMKLQFSHSESSNSAYQLWVNLVPGKYHGVHAEPMGQ